MQIRRLLWLVAGVLVTGASASSCSTQRKAVSLPVEGRLVRDQLIIHSDFELAHHHRLVEEMVLRRDDMVRLLRLPVSDEPIQIYLFDSAQNFRAYMRKYYPSFPPRRAFFVESDTELSVYAHWGDRVAEDLRHEVAHGYLHSMVPGIPLWLDEGLAEYFEVPRGWRGRNQAHLDLLLAEVTQNRWRPAMAPLEQLQSPAEMTQLDYAESWAWVHFLLRTTAARRDLMRNHLARIRMTGTVPALAVRLTTVEPDAERNLVKHLLRLSERPET